MRCAVAVCNPSHKPEAFRAHPALTAPQFCSAGRAVAQVRSGCRPRGGGVLSRGGADRLREYLANRGVAFVTTFGPVAQVKGAVPRGDGDRGTPLRHSRDPFHTAPCRVSRGSLGKRPLVGW